MSHPNIFNFATKELSQDAFIVWLLSWADVSQKASVLYKVGLALLNAMLEKHGESNVIDPKVEIRKQWKGADFIVVVNGEVVVLVEDKARASVHGDQLQRYLAAAKENFPDARAILPTFFKTGDQANYDAVTALGYRLFLRADLLRVLREQDVADSGNAILCDYKNYLETWEERVNSWRKLPLSQWVDDFDAWVGLYSFLKERAQDLDWGYVPNPSGGFVGCWWHSMIWKDSEVGGGFEVYLQIEQGSLCCKVVVPLEKIPDGFVVAVFRGGVRDRWAALVTGNDSLFKLPKRRGSGSVMTVASVDINDWLVLDGEGLVDVDATLEKIHLAEKILDGCVR